MTKVLFLNGGAAIRGRDTAYLELDGPQAFLNRGGINLGDMLVYDATLKIIEFDGISNIQFRENWQARDIDRINAEHGVCIIRGSNYFAESIDLGDLVPLVEKLKMPIVPIGVGAQAATYKRLRLPEGTKRFLKAVAERCHSIGVRGHYSAEVLNDAGIKNVSVIGCPSIFRSLRPTQKIQKKPWSEDLRVGLTLNKYLSGEYAEDQIKSLRLQREFLVLLANMKSSVLYSQGEKDEFILANGLKDLEQQALRSILAKYSLSEDDPAVVDFLRSRTKVFLDIDSWGRDVADVDFMIGFRLHGNVMALHQGIPAVFYTYDSRVKEIAELFHMPFIDSAGFRRIDIRQIYEATDFDAFEAAYARQYSHLAAFLDANGLRHRLTPPAPSEQPVIRGEGAPDVGTEMKLPIRPEDMAAWYDREISWMTQEIARLRSRDWHLTRTIQDLRQEAAKTAMAAE